MADGGKQIITLAVRFSSWVSGIGDHKCIHWADIGTLEGLFSQAVTHYERVLKRAEAGEVGGSSIPPVAPRLTVHFRQLSSSGRQRTICR